MIPKNFRNTQETSIASYDFTDIASGTGVVTFYLGISGVAPSTLSYFLSSNSSFWSDFQIAQVDNTTTTLNFDLTPFNLPQTVNGTAYINCAIGITSTGGEYAKFQLFKVSGGTPEAITAQVAGSITLAAGEKMVMVELPITKKTNFKKGDILRLAAELKSDGGVGHIIAIGADPANRGAGILDPATNTDITTISRLFIPFDIDT